MSIKSYIESYPNKTDNEILSEVNNASIRQVDTKLKTSRDIASIYGTTFAAQVLGAFEAVAQNNPLFKSIMIALGSVGLNFSDTIVQDSINNFQQAGVFTSEQATELKELGIKNVSPSHIWIGRDATIEDINSARLEISKDNLIKEATTRINNVWAGIGDGSITSTNDIINRFSN